MAIIMPNILHQSFKTFYTTISTREIQFYMKELFTTLEAVHKQNIVHRDIKPNNILWDYSSQCKFDSGRSFCVIDFGLAEEVSETRNFSYFSLVRALWRTNGEKGCCIL